MFTSSQKTQEKGRHWQWWTMKMTGWSIFWDWIPWHLLIKVVYYFLFSAPSYFGIKQNTILISCFWTKLVTRDFLLLWLISFLCNLFLCLSCLSLVSVSLWHLHSKNTWDWNCHLLTLNFIFVRLIKLLKDDSKWFLILCSLTYKCQVSSRKTKIDFELIRVQLWLSSLLMTEMSGSIDFLWWQKSPADYLYTCIVLYSLPSLVSLGSQ